MANMLRKATSGAHGCCSACARKVKVENKPGRRERRMARAGEKRRWRREARRDG